MSLTRTFPALQPAILFTHSSLGLAAACSRLLQGAEPSSISVRSYSICGRAATQSRVVSSNSSGCIHYIYNLWLHCGFPLFTRINMQRSSLWPKFKLSVDYSQALFTHCLLRLRVCPLHLKHVYAKRGKILGTNTCVKQVCKSCSGAFVMTTFCNH